MRNYVDWSKVPAGINWINIADWSKPENILRSLQGWSYKPFGPTGGGIFNSDIEVYRNGHDMDLDTSAIIGPLPPWRKSLIHRPGINNA